jgi:alpha-galactosidase
VLLLGKEFEFGGFKTNDIHFEVERIPLGWKVKGMIKRGNSRVEILRMKSPRKILAGGWQSWSPFQVFDLNNFQPQNGDWRFKHTPIEGEKNVFDYLITFENTVVGFLSSRYAHPFFTYKDNEIAAYLEYFYPVHEELPLEPLVILKGENLSLLLETYAALIAEENQVSFKRKSVIGWSSWYQYYTDLEWKDVLKNLKLARDFSIEVFQVDDGYEADIGDWLNVKDGFPELGEVATKIKESGFTPGIWVSPFIVSESSKIFKTHKDWVVRENGKPLMILKNWDKEIYPLDLTNSEVLNWLKALFSKLKSMGFEYFKLDFLFAGAVPGERKEKISPLLAYRNAMKIIREVLRDSYILGCGAPLLPSAGFFDLMRIGDDTAARWKGEGLSASKALKNALTRYFFNKRLWRNDPDCLILRESKTDLTKEQRETYAYTAAVLDNLIFLGDDLGYVRNEGKSILKRALSLLGGKARILNVMSEDGKYEIVSRGANAGNIRLEVDIERGNYKIGVDESGHLGKKTLIREGRIFNFYGEGNDAGIKI